MKWAGQQWARPRAGDRCLPSPAWQTLRSFSATLGDWLAALPSRGITGHRWFQTSRTSPASRCTFLPTLSASRLNTWSPFSDCLWAYTSTLCPFACIPKPGIFKHFVTWQHSPVAYMYMRMGSVEGRVTGQGTADPFTSASTPNSPKSPALQGAVWRSLPWTTETTS